uniref:G-protein coupled receptors family 1 profile domain-containing protein n=1 Tax=Knipowitschia caucasica TaxID=637954 RepID=A0AAV2MTE2_KNICA
MASANGSSYWLIDCMSSDSGLYTPPSILSLWLLLMVPLWILVLSTTLQRWRRVERFVVSHSDFFTYHSLFFDLLNCSYHILISIANFQHDANIFLIAVVLSFFLCPGLLLLHTFTCIERYIAVVFPVLYLTLRQRRGIWVRNCIVLGIWGVCWLYLGLFFVIPVTDHTIPLWILVSFVTIVISFCCVQVLFALRNPSPGDGQGLSRSRQRAFFTMVIIVSSLWLWLMSGIIPTSIVLPLLFLHRAGKLPKCFQRQ